MYLPTGVPGVLHKTSRLPSASRVSTFVPIPQVLSDVDTSATQATIKSQVDAKQEELKGDASLTAAQKKAACANSVVDMFCRSKEFFS